MGFNEYLEMVIQFGFCTIFVIALPNNIAEIRIDANKLLAQVRRPVTKVVKDIGAWEYIIDMIAVISVIANGCLIAFTSEFIPRVIYHINHCTYEDTGNQTSCFYKHGVYADKASGDLDKNDWT